MAVALDQPLLVVAVLEREQREASCWTVSNGSTQSSCSLSVRMKRSAQPLPSGAATNDGLERMPRKRSSPWKWSLRYWLPWSWRRPEPGGDARPVAAVVRPQPLAERLERLEARAGASRVDADALLRAVVVARSSYSTVTHGCLLLAARPRPTGSWESVF